MGRTPGRQGILDEELRGGARPGASRSWPDLKNKHSTHTVLRGEFEYYRKLARVLLQNVVLLAFLAPACTQPVEITSVGPSEGSLAGGTRIHIRGSGFSNNMGGLRPSLCLPP